MLRSERSERLEAWAPGRCSLSTPRRTLLSPVGDAAHWTARHSEVRGVTLVVLSSLAFSTAGFFTRLIDTDVWTMLFWRGLFGGLFIAGYIVWRERAGSVLAFKRIGRAGLVAAACSTAATICFVNALRETTVADVLVINATAPFMTAGLAWAWTGARERWTTLAASLVALLGVAVTVGAGLASGHLLGNFLALLMTILISTMMVVIRRYRGVDMLPAASLSAFLCALVVWPWAEPASATGWNFFYLVLFGTTQFGLGLLLLTAGTRLISATRSALIGALETPLAPALVWLAFAEVPPLATCLGGAIVLAAVVGDLLVTRERS
jgi:drug/metabolite transporter (DMT)-like permease